MGAARAEVETAEVQLERVPSDVNQRLRFDALVKQNISVLQDFCSELGVVQSGTKTELALRMLQDIQEQFEAGDSPASCSVNVMVSQGPQHYDIATPRTASGRPPGNFGDMPEEEAAWLEVTWAHVD